MKKNLWIWNHYATNMFKDQSGRHYWFAENLMRQGYNVTIFCASTIHNTTDIIETGDQKYRVNVVNQIPFVFVKTPRYSGNGTQRIKNMIGFYKNLSPVAKAYAKLSGKPDLILASSVHPLTLVAGIKIAKKFGIPCICEVRDLWPESLVAYGVMDPNSIITKILYHGEKWIYQKADSIIMTWEGGIDYIRDRGWDKEINLKKIKHISNGIVLESFDKNVIDNQMIDIDLDNSNYKNIVYTGSIRKVNNIGMLLDVAQIIQNRGLKDIRFLIFGAGDECEVLKNRCHEENIDNVIFKGRVGKKYVPSILKKSYINILHNSSTSLDKYGQSQNKLFEYLAAGKGILQTYSTGYSVFDRNECGICTPTQNPTEIADAIIELCKDEAQCHTMGRNARKVASEFDFSQLTEKLIEIIEENI